MTRIVPGAVAAGLWAVFLALETAHAAGRCSIAVPPGCHATRVDCSRCIVAEPVASPLPSPATDDKCAGAEDALTPPSDAAYQPTLAIPTELPHRGRGLVIEVPVEAELGPAGVAAPDEPNRVESF